MRFLILFLLSVLGFEFSSFASEISKSDILATIRHMEALAKDQKSQLLAAQSDFQKQALELQAAQAEAKLMARQASLWEHRTEVIVEIGAFFFAAWLGTILSGLVLKNLPSLEGWMATVVVYALSFFLGMWLLNHFLDLIGQLIPTIPSWDQSVRWFHTLHPKDLVR